MTGDILKVVLEYQVWSDGHAHIVVVGVYRDGDEIPAPGPYTLNRNVVGVFEGLTMSRPAFGLGPVTDEDARLTQR